MTESKEPEIDLRCNINNDKHHTKKISVEQLIVRRGQSFALTLKLFKPFKPDEDPLFITTSTGDDSSEKQGTLCFLSIPDGVKRSPEAKAVWKIELSKECSPSQTGVLELTVTPPADAPVGKYNMVGPYKAKQTKLASLTVLFNPWCPDDWVYLHEEKLRQEYVMNENGVIFTGSTEKMIGEYWDYGQFEENMVDICLSLLDLNHKHKDDPADDVSARCNPIYVGRVISAMINHYDDKGVLEGNWSGDFSDGYSPAHWTGSNVILTKWMENDFKPVKYGQCWVFAGVMCSVMRFFGIPCRIISNFQSAHDNNANLTIERYHSENGIVGRQTIDSIWNFHVWIEGWMRRPDMSEKGGYDGWQVLDPTPQEKSDGIFCCGPSPKAAIKEGRTDIKYDTPFVYAEVNADVIDWLVKRNGFLEKIETDTSIVGQYISTKAVGSNKRVDITDTYKVEEGKKEERTNFRKARLNHFKHLNRKREEKKKRKKEEMERKRNEETEGNRNEETEGNRNEETEGSRNEGTEGSRNEGTEGNRNEETEGNRNEETEGSRNEGTEGNRNEGTEGNRNEETEGSRNEGTEGNRNEGTEENGMPNTTGNESTGETDDEAPEVTPPPPKVSIRFEKVSKPINGQDVNWKLVLRSESTADRPLIINIGVQAMNYNGHLSGDIQSDKKEKTLLPGKDLIIPIVVPFSVYCKPMLLCDSMKISALVRDIEKPDHPYLGEVDVVLINPPVTVTIPGEVKLYNSTSAEILFMNPVNEVLKDCTVTISGIGLWRGENEFKLPDIKPNRRIRLKFFIVPYRLGERTLTADLDCSIFKDIKGRCTVTVKH